MCWIRDDQDGLEIIVIWSKVIKKWTFGMTLILIKTKAYMCSDNEMGEWIMWPMWKYVEILLEKFNHLVSEIKWYTHVFNWLWCTMIPANICNSHQICVGEAAGTDEHHRSSQMSITLQMENYSLGNSLRYSVALLSWQRTLALWSHLWHVTSKTKRSRHNHTQQIPTLKSRNSSKAGTRINDIWKVWAGAEKEIKFRHFSIMGWKAKYQFDLLRKKKTFESNTLIFIKILAKSQTKWFLQFLDHLFKKADIKTRFENPQNTKRGRV